MTFFAGENGSGKSTLVEAIAIAAGFNAEGGSRNVTVSTRASHSDLHKHLRLVRGTSRPRTGYFLRAESFFNVATYIEALGDRRSQLPTATGHFMSVLTASRSSRWCSTGSVRRASTSSTSRRQRYRSRGNLALMRRMHDLVAEGSQFIVSTHSPILLGYPDAKIYVLSGEGIAPLPYEKTEVVELTRAFLDGRDQFLRHLFED